MKIQTNSKIFSSPNVDTFAFLIAKSSYPTETDKSFCITAFQFSFFQNRCSFHITYLDETTETISPILYDDYHPQAIIFNANLHKIDILDVDKNIVWSRSNVKTCSVRLDSSSSNKQLYLGVNDL